MKYSRFILLPLIIAALWVLLYLRDKPAQKPPAQEAPLIKSTAGATPTNNVLQQRWDKQKWRDDVISKWEPTKYTHNDRELLCQHYNLDPNSILSKAAAQIHGDPALTDFHDLTERQCNQALDTEIVDKMAEDLAAREQKFADAGTTGDLQAAVFAQVDAEARAERRRRAAKKEQDDEYRNSLRQQSK